MKIAFFDTSCREAPRVDELFGLCDDTSNNEKAYTDIHTKEDWIAVVINKNKREITFTAIDHCIVAKKKNSHDDESTCDGMLTFSENLYLAELKKRGSGRWKKKGVSQLENTIKLLMNNSDLKDFKFKKAYVCNSKSPNFIVIQNELKLRFFKMYGFRLHIEAIIHIN
ncbi:MAG: hypothetical protein AAGI07_00095 [Bacteroidota bacterium]